MIITFDEEGSLEGNYVSCGCLNKFTLTAVN